MKRTICCMFMLLVAMNVRAQDVGVDSLQGLIPSTPIPGTQRVPSDINGDGFSDLFWTNPFKHEVGYWLMGTDSSGKVYRTSGVILKLDSGMFVGAVGDFNGDGFADVALTNAQRELRLWTNDHSGNFNSSTLPSYPADWQLLGAGDVDGDGQDDLLWFNKDSCQFGYWLIRNGARVGLKIVPVTCGYTPVAIGYFSPSPRISIAWTSSVLHDLWIWDSSGHGFVSSNVTPPDFGKTLIGFGGGLAGQGIAAMYRRPFADGDIGTFGSYEILNRSFDQSGHQTEFSWTQTWSNFVNLPWSVGGALISGRGAQGASLIQQYGNGSMDICAPGALSPPHSDVCTQFNFPRGWFMVGAPGNGAGPLGKEMTP